MSQTTGVNTLFFVDGFDLSTDLNRVAINRSAEAPESTTFQPAGKTRQRLSGGLKDWSMSLDGLFNDISPSGVEEYVSGILGAGSMVACYFKGDLTGSQKGYEGTPRTITLNVESPVDGVVTVAVEVSGSGPLLRATSIRSGSFDSSGGSVATNSIDLGAGGGGTVRGFLRVYRETGLGSGSEIQVKLQHSSDDSVFTDLGSFSDASGSTFEQKQFTSANRYIRAHLNPLGTDPTAWVFVSVAEE